MKRKSVFLVTVLLAVAAMVFVGCTGKKEAGTNVVSGGDVNLVQIGGGGTPTFVNKDGEVWAFEDDDTWGLIFQSDGKVFDVRKMGGSWFSQRQNGTWTGNTWDGKTLSVNGNTLTLSYVSYIDDETGEERISTDTYVKETGQNIEIRH